MPKNYRGRCPPFSESISGKTSIKRATNSLRSGHLIPSVRLPRRQSAELQPQPHIMPLPLDLGMVLILRAAMQNEHIVHELHITALHLEGEREVRTPHHLVQTIQRLDVLSRQPDARD